MAERKLINEQVANELPAAIDLIIHTKVPDKYMLIDCETGQVYKGHKSPNQNYWKKLGVLTKIPEYEES